MLSYFHLHIKMFLKSIVGNCKMKLKKAWRSHPPTLEHLSLVHKQAIFRTFEKYMAFFEKHLFLRNKPPTAHLWEFAKLLVFILIEGLQLNLSSNNGLCYNSLPMCVSCQLPRISIPINVKELGVYTERNCEEAVGGTLSQTGTVSVFISSPLLIFTLRNGLG